jgi:secondary thiamine-phosphate synthase enzyme
MLFEHTIKTGAENFIDITSEVKKDVAESGVRDGICIVCCPHTTAGITINENADPDVAYDMQKGLQCAADRVLPVQKHAEGNSDAHIKASLMGSSATLIIDGGRLLLGTWQGIYFCEFDGPRTRKFYVKVM